jgi:ketosteroid isomerase-like protein
MNAVQDKEKILKLAKNLDTDLERKAINKLIPYFSEDCEIEIFGLTLKGHKDLEKWLNWFFDLFDIIQFEPIVIIVKNNIFFEEFGLKATYNHGKSLDVKLAEVLEYKNYKIRSLRLYLDRLQFSDVLAKSFFSKMLVNIIKKKSLKDLR